MARYNHVETVGGEIAIHRSPSNPKNYELVRLRDDMALGSAGDLKTARERAVAIIESGRA
jgi:hypothetical protein